MLDNPADFYLDFQRFDALRVDARNGDESAAQSVARQFEGLFVQQMLSAMRAAAQIDPDQHNAYLDFYHEMYDKQLAQSIAGEDRLGVARMILRQIERVDGDGAPPAAAPVIAIGGADGSAAPSAPPVIADGQVAAIAPAAAIAGPGSPVPPVSGAFRADGDAADPALAGVRLGRVVDDDFAELARRDGAAPAPDDFVVGVWPAARAAAGRLGVSPRLLVAQAALESGWGRHTMKFADGRDSFNLFGIKAGADWSGAVIRKQSLEFEDGALRPRLSVFRAYDSPAQSFADYADFIRGRPHYADALAVAGDERAYIRAVHAAGYATDPDYADKVIGILDGAVLRRGIAQLDHGERNYG